MGGLNGVGDGDGLDDAEGSASGDEKVRVVFLVSSCLVHKQ